MLRLLLLLFFILTTVGLPGQAIRGLYVNKTDDILENPELEEDLLEYLIEGQFNHVLFYSLYRLNFEDPTTTDNLRRLIRRLRTEGEIKYVGAVQENYEQFEHAIHPFNISEETDSLERFNVYNVEFEFWSTRAVTEYYCEKYLRPVGFPCTEDGAFLYVQKSLEALQHFKRDLPELTTEIYVGWLEPRHAEKLSGLVDRVLPAVYREENDEGEIELYHFSHQRERLMDLASGGEVHILPIFNGAENTIDLSLYVWLLNSHTLCEPWELYASSFALENNTLIRENIHLDGYVWFKYFAMPPIPSSLMDPGPIQGNLDPILGDTLSYSIHPVAGADYYRWWFTRTDTVIKKPATDTTLTWIFDKPGLETLHVQAFGCAEKSIEAIINLEVQESGTGIRDLYAPGWELSQSGIGGSLHLNIRKPLSEKHTLTVHDLSGQLIHQKSLDNGFVGTYIFNPGIRNQVLIVTLQSSQQIICSKLYWF